MRFLEDLAKSASTVPEVKALAMSNIGVSLGRVTDNVDPKNLRRLKLELEQFPGLSTDWVPCAAPYTSADFLLPKIGELVLVHHINGSPDRLVWLGVLINTSNPAFSQSDVVADTSTHTPGKKLEAVTEEYNIVSDKEVVINVGNSQIRVLGDTARVSVGDSVLTMKDNSVKIESSGGSVTLENNEVRCQNTSNSLIANLKDGTSFIGNGLYGVRVTQLGYITVSTPTGTWRMGAGGQGCTIENTEAIHLVTPRLEWNGRRVSLVGDFDTRGDMNV